MRRLMVLIVMVAVILGIQEISLAGNTASHVVSFEVRIKKEVTLKAEGNSIVAKVKEAGLKPREITVSLNEAKDLSENNSKIIDGNLKISRTALEISEAGSSQNTALTVTDI